MPDLRGIMGRSMALAQTLSPDTVLRTAVGLYERYGRLLPGVAAALFAILLGRAAADLVWALVPLPEAARSHAPAPPPSAAPRGPQAGDVNTIVAAALFGRYQAEAPETTLLNAPETPLNMTLLGVLADDREPTRSRALIRVQGGDEKGYAIGDDVARGVTLQAIFPDRVILSRGGRLETLRLERDQPSAGGGTAAPGPAPAASDANDGRAPTLANIREEVVRDPSKAADYVRVQPANVAGQLKGYRIYPGRDRSVFTQAGLRPGDLVTAVNGVQLDDPAKALQLLGDLGTAGQVNLVVERGGQTQNISINLSQ